MTTTEANRLRVHRAERRMTQLTLANVTRIHPTRIWKIENGRTVPTPRERLAIASALGVDVANVWTTVIDDRKSTAQPVTDAI